MRLHMSIGTARAMLNGKEAMFYDIGKDGRSVLEKLINTLKLNIKYTTIFSHPEFVAYHEGESDTYYELKDVVHIICSKMGDYSLYNLEKGELKALETLLYVYDGDAVKSTIKIVEGEKLRVYSLSDNLYDVLDELSDDWFCMRFIEDTNWMYIYDADNDTNISLAEAFADLAEGVDESVLSPKEIEHYNILKNVFLKEE